MDPSTFEYLKPTDQQLYNMANMRAAFAQFAIDIEAQVPDGPDLDHVMLLIRDAAMWVNVAITRNPDGSPRT